MTIYVQMSCVSLIGDDILIDGDGLVIQNDGLVDFTLREKTTLSIGDVDFFVELFFTVENELFGTGGGGLSLTMFFSTEFLRRIDCCCTDGFESI